MLDRRGIHRKWNSVGSSCMKNAIHKHFLVSNRIFVSDLTLFGYHVVKWGNLKTFLFPGFSQIFGTKIVSSKYVLDWNQKVFPNQLKTVMAAIYTHKSPFYKAAQDDECWEKSKTKSIYAHNANVGKLSSLQNCDMILLKLCFENHSLTCFKLFPKIENATS